MNVPFDITRLMGQWMTIAPQAPDPNEMLIVNLDYVSNASAVTGSANYANAGPTGGGEQYTVSVTATGSAVVASARMVARFDSTYRRAEVSDAPAVAASIELGASADTVEVSFNRGSAELVKWELTRASLGTSPTSISHGMDWKQFCAWAHKQSEHHRRFVYRGHKRHAYPLRTAFHRTGRTDLLRYLYSDFQELQYRISALTQRRFNIWNLDEQLELMSLGQHHGYPTPFLDWTESPFIAAFFAFTSNKVGAHEKGDEVKVRIIQCDASLLRPAPPPQVLSDPRYMVGVVRPGALQNPRAIPQQSVFMFSNIVEVDTFLNQVATVQGRPLLQLIDISINQRREALHDLRAMGITEASMFPGIDGTCRDLAQLQFG